MKNHAMFPMLLMALFITFTGFSQNRTTSQRVQQLPLGHQLKSSFDALPPQAKVKAENWLNRMNIPEEDFKSLRIDKLGSVFYADSFLANTEAESTQSVPTVSLAIPSANEIFTLHSKPGAPYTVHLDFDGMYISGRIWNDANGGIYDARPYDKDGNESSFNEAERGQIASIWQRVSDDYAPFNIDVTTEEPSSYGPNVGHVLITKNSDKNNRSMPSSGGGGVAYVNIFGSGSTVYYSPALVYYNNSGNEHGNANTTSHEFGHNLGLSHHGGGGDGEYYRGHGSGFTSWAPLMGSYYTKNVTQWDHGSYSNPSNPGQDDIVKLVSELAYRSDDHGNSTGSATPLIIEADGSVNAIHEEMDPFDLTSNNKGIIERSSDLDYFSFSTSGGQINLTITPSYLAFDDDSYRSSNLDVRAKLYNNSGSLINTYSISNDIKADISDNLIAGTYYISIEGEGSSNYSDYASLGKYYISGSIDGGNGTGGGLTTDFAMLGDFGEDDSQASSVANLVNSWDIDFVTTAGDNRYGTINFQQAVGNKYCQWIANPGINCSGSATVNKFFPAPGNHDYDDGGGINEYLNYFDLPGNGVNSTNTSGNERYYDVIQGDVHFFMLDSDAAISSSSDRTAQQNWLQTQLAASTANWKVVILHHAPYSSGNHGNNSTMQWPYASWGADVVMAGHDHHYERIHKDGIVYIVNGLGGRSLYNLNTPISGSQIQYNSNYGAVLASVDGDTMNVKFINISGSTIDDYNIIQTVTPPNDGIVDVQVSGSLDDVEEKASDGSIDATSSDIELGDDPGFNEDQTVGLLFRNIDIPQGATITSAYLEFTVDEVDTGSTSVVIKAQDANNASDFLTSINNITNRTTTSASVNWDIPAWNTISEKKQSPDISSLVQKVVDRTGWSSGNKMVLVITGTGSRTAESYDGSAGNAARLHIEYEESSTNNNPIASFTDSVSDRTVSFTDTSTDSDGSIVSWSWDFGDGNTSTEQHPIHNYATDGTLNVILTVTDDQGATDNTSQNVTTCLDTDGDGVCDDQDICPGGDDSLDTDGDGTPDFCDSCNELLDTDNDGYNDCIDQEIDSPCPGNVDSNGVSIDSDGDTVPDCLDICSGDDTVDSDGDGTPDDCDTCPNSATGDSDGDGVCDDLDICPGGDDSVDTDADGTPDFCDTCDDLVDTDGDGYSDCVDQEIDSPCPSNVDTNGVSIDSDGDSVPDCLDICAGDDMVDSDSDGTPDDCDACPNSATGDSDGDGVCDDLDICPGGDDNVDTDGDGTPDFCDTSVCQPGNAINFNSNTLNVTGSQTDNSSDNFLPLEAQDVSFTVSGMNHRTGGKPVNRYIEEVTITYVDGSGSNQTYGVFGSGNSEVNVSISGFVQSVTVSLTDGYDGNTNQNLSVNLNQIDYCVETITCTDTDSDGVCDGDDDQINSPCPNLVDSNGVSLDSDGDGVCDEFDNCPNRYNPDQESDGDCDGILTVEDCDDNDANNINSNVNDQDCDGVPTADDCNDNDPNITTSNKVDSDGDGVNDCVDNCPNTANPGQEDVDFNGVGDACDNPVTCDPQTTSGTTLTHNGTGNSKTTFNINGQDVSFSITGLDQRTGGKKSNRYIEEVTVTYDTGDGNDQVYDVFNGTSDVTVSLGSELFVVSITVSLADGYDGNYGNAMSVNIGTIDFCMESVAPAVSQASVGTDSSLIEEIKVYPNPVSSKINISLIGYNDLKASIFLYSFSGQIVLKRQLKSDRDQINVNNLADGIYMLIINDQNGFNLASKRIVVKK